MIAPPPPAIVQCIDPASAQALQARVLWEVRGPAADVDTLLKSSNAEKWIEASKDEAVGDQRHVVLMVKQTASCRDIGGFIYRAQSAGIDVTSRFDPPICEKSN